MKSTSLNGRMDTQLEDKTILKFNQIQSQCGRYIYHVSLIDYLQKYDLNKKMERAAKLIAMGVRKSSMSSNSGHFEDESKFVGDDLSVVNPKLYRQRFLDFCKSTVFS